MAYTNNKIEPCIGCRNLMAPIVFDNVRSTDERTSNRKRQCYGSMWKIDKGEKYINHQFRYDGRIITISFCLSYFNGYTPPNTQLT